jgi:RNA recognition motif-containing protein
LLISLLIAVLFTQAGYAFVEFTEDSMGDRAIRELNSTEHNGRLIRCSIARKKTPRDQQQQQQQQQPRSNHSQPQHQMQGPPNGMPMMPMMPMIGPNGFIMAPMMPPMPMMGGAPMEQSSLLGGPWTPAQSSSSAGSGAGTKDPPPPNQNLFINGIPFSWGEEELLSLFKPFGAISHTKILQSAETGKSRGQGFVHYDNVQSAQAAMAAWHMKRPPNSDTFLQVRYAYAKDGGQRQSQQQQQGSAPMQFQSSAAPLSYAPSSYTAAPSAAEESNYGPDRKGRTTARHNPMARPTSATTSASQQQQQQQQQSSYGADASQQQQPRQASSSGSGDPSQEASVFVFYLPKSVTKEELTKLFAPYGQVMDVAIPVDKHTGEHKGFAFVNYNSKEEAENVRIE